MSNLGKLADSALKLLRNYPRVSLNNIKDLPGSLIKKKPRRNLQKGRKHGRGDKGQGQRMTLPRLGFEGGQTPFYLRVPKEPYYEGHHQKRQYPPLSLLELQRMIDIGRVDASQPIDLTTLCNTKLYKSDPVRKHYGVNLTDEGEDIFVAKVNIEVQRASELTIAAIERNGGVITTRFYDLHVLHAITDPERFFKKGVPIPKCKLPPEDAVEYYSDPRRRGYLADPEKICEARFELAQKYGYDLPDLENDEMYEILKMRKDPRQIFFGLAPGWVVNLRDKVIIKPKSEKYTDFYRS